MMNVLFSFSMGRSGCGSKLKSVVLSGCGNITDLAIERLSKGLESAPCRPPDTPDDSQEAKETHPSVSDKCVCKKTTKFVCRRKEGCSTPNLCAQKNVTVLNDEPYGRLCCKDRRTNTGNSKYRTFSPSICHDNAHNETYGQGADNPELWGVKYGVEEKTCSAPPHGESFSSESCHQVAPAVAVPDASCHASCSHEHAAGGLGCIEDCAPQVHLGRHFVSSLTTEEEDDTWPCGTRPAATGTSGGRALRLLNLSGCYLITDEGLRWVHLSFTFICNIPSLRLFIFIDQFGNILKKMPTGTMRIFLGHFIALCTCTEPLLLGISSISGQGCIPLSQKGAILIPILAKRYHWYWYQ